MRRGEARSEASERVVFRSHGKLLDGWALNASRGGLRAILETKVELGDLFEVRRGEDGWRPGRVVWIQDEPDGVVVGVAYLDTANVASVKMAAVTASPLEVSSADLRAQHASAQGADTGKGSFQPAAQSEDAEHAEHAPLTKKSAQ